MRNDENFFEGNQKKVHIGRREEGKNPHWYSKKHSNNNKTIKVI